MFEIKICPKCGEKELVEVLYGLPTEEAFEASLKGLIKLEGCCLPEGYNGEDIYYCNNCRCKIYSEVNRKTINVVAGVIRDEEGKILITQRNFKKAQGGLWEFPGGKIEPGESKEEAIVREIKEELNIDIKFDSYLDEKVFEYPEKTINLIALNCTKINGEIKLMEHEAYAWVKDNELRDYEFAPADYFIIKKI